MQIVNDLTGSQTWRAPSLDCEPVGGFMAFRSGEEITDSSEQVMTSYSIGEPDAALFEASSLQEVSPMVAAVTQYERIGLPEAEMQKVVESLSSSEQKYNAFYGR